MHRPIGLVVIALLLLSTSFVAHAANGSLGSGIGLIEAISQAAADPLDPEDYVPSGATLDILASATHDDNDPAERLRDRPDLGAQLNLERVPLDPGESIDGRALILGEVCCEYHMLYSHLLYVEQGTVVVATGDGEGVFTEGSVAFVPPCGDFHSCADPYNLRNDTGDCVSLLRLRYSFSNVQAAGPARRNPLVDPRRQQPVRLLEVTDDGDNWPAGVSSRLFIARLSWGEEELNVTSDSLHSYSGLVGVVVETGRLEVGTSDGSSIVLTKGEGVSIPHGVQHTVNPIGSRRTSALMVGFVPAFESTSDSLNTGGERVASSGVSGSAYTSPTYGYTLEWDPNEWQSISDGELVAEGEVRLDRFGLSNGVSEIWVDAETAYGGDSGVCLEDQEDQLRRAGGISDVEVATSVDNEPIAGEGQDFAFSVYFFTVTDDEGTGAAVTAFIECQTLVPGTSVLVITHIARSEDYNDQIAARVALLEGLSVSISS